MIDSMDKFFCIKGFFITHKSSRFQIKKILLRYTYKLRHFIMLMNLIESQSVHDKLKTVSDNINFILQKYDFVLQNHK